MIHKLLRRVFGRRDDPNPTHKHRVIPVAKHGLKRESISPCALKTVGELQRAGFSAFVVGGAVRDLLLGLQPKDYDVATSATPDEVRALFRRSRIIGRRFRIVHVLCGRDTVEVSTFRAHHPGAHDDDPSTDEHGRLLRDNVFGNQVEDAVRRDFTVNALFYDPAREEIWDYHDGVTDLKAKRLRMIGAPVTRYREDPVRMLRAVRLSAKLGFEIDPKTQQPIQEMATLLANVPESRLFDEMLKLLMSGASAACVQRLRTVGLHHGLLPMLDVILEQPMGERFVTLALANTDERVRQDKPVSPAFLFAALLWHEVLAATKVSETAALKAGPALHEAMDKVLNAQTEKLAIPRRYEGAMKELWMMQPRFLQRAGQRPFRLLEHPRFRAGYDFLLLRCQSGEVDGEVGEWWTRFQDAGDGERQAMLLQDQGPKKRRRRGPRKNGEGQGGAVRTIGTEQT